MPFPQQLSDTWTFLHGEVVWLHGRWSMFNQLYATSEVRLEALNKVAPTFFGTLQRVLLNDIQLALSRLGDPSRMARRENLTLETLVDAISELREPALAAALSADLAVYRERCRMIVTRRNQWIAHYDISLRSPAERLPGVSRQEIEEALEQLRVFMRRVYGHYMNAHMAYEMFVLNDDANNIVRVVAEALRYRQLMDQGTIDYADFITSDFARI